VEGGEAPEAVAGSGDARPESAVQDKDERGGTARVIKTEQYVPSLPAASTPGSRARSPSPGPQEASKPAQLAGKCCVDQRAAAVTTSQMVFISVIWSMVDLNVLYRCVAIPGTPSEVLFSLVAHRSWTIA